MAAYAEPALRAWLQAQGVAAVRGDHRPARDWLMHAGVIDPLPDAGKGSGPAVVIINAPMPGMPGYVPSPSVIDVPSAGPAGAQNPVTPDAPPLALGGPRAGARGP